MGATNSRVPPGPLPGRYRGDYRRLRQLHRSLDRDDMIEETSTPLENEAPAELSNTGSLCERFPLLDQCVHELSTLKLENHVKTAGTVIDNLGEALRKASDAQDASRFLATIERLKAQDTQTKTVVGVVGDTGSGKSSMINALLDEEMIVPTNCMRACTSVITELSYNYSDDPQERYRAEVEFISPADWKKELTQLSRDLLNNAGEVAQESANTDTETGISWAKIKAVYPEQTRGGLANMNVEAIAGDPRVKAVLGSKHTITNADASMFFETMQQYIDSQEVETQNKTPGSRKKLQYWPLIKVVRMFIKADVLSTGAVIVDLPGVQDSNAARAAVAENYIKNCKYVWVVAPITRAVDDKTARKLMGESFKLQLKLDGKYDRVSFICSKTDDISVVEASNSFRLDEEISACQRKLQDILLEVAKNEDEVKSIVVDFKQVEAIEGQVQEQLAHWQKQLHNLITGMEARPYSALPLKRRGSAGEKSCLKKPRLTMDLDEMMSFSDSDSDIDNTEVQEVAKEVKQEEIKVEEDEEAKPLTIDQVWKEINNLQAEKLSLQRKRDKLKAEAEPVRLALKKSRKTQAKLQVELKSLSDHDLAMRENEQSFDPQNDRRDYEAISSSFPVFCVSSKVYQRANGRLEGDDVVQGFPTQDSTGIPRLRKYAKQLTESAREDVSRRYMKDFRQFIQTLSLWTQKHDSRDQLTKDMFKSDLDRLERQLEQAANATTERCRGILSNSLYDKFDQSSSAAAKAAIKTGEGWFGPRNTGGFAWNTYKSICIRDGVHFTRSAGQVNLNEDLALPLKMLLANSWESVFTRRIPTAIAEFPVTAESILKRFHNSVKGRVPNKDHDILHASLTENVRYEDVFTKFMSRVTVVQRDANRGFAPAVTDNMKKAYRDCATQSGPGMYSRMRDITLSRIKKKRNAMFREAANGVRTKLDTISEELESELFGRITQSIKAITLDFESGIIGSNLAQASRAARVEVRGILSTTDALFEAPADDAPNDGADDDVNIVRLD
ncbi:hypothetical protein BJ166DRAFT_611252 [Pestalotiopsis sp. NC0098]|nr:hypothetical protein BJ166DRAFT_611252 [Pestalotiopsis sp. NC0098]